MKNIEKENSDFTIIKDEVKTRDDEKNRVYHTIEGKYKDYYFFAKTDNSHLFGYGTYGIKKGCVYKLDVWVGGHPVGRDYSVKGEGIHVSEDFVADYWNKWGRKPKSIQDKKAVDEIVNYLDSICSNVNIQGGKTKKVKGTFKPLGKVKELSVKPIIAGHDMVAKCDCGGVFTYKDSEKNIAWECPECKGMKRICSAKK